MMWEYCANCGSISMKLLSGRTKQCNKCGWKGVPDRGDMATINSRVKAMVRNPQRMVTEKYLDENGNPTGAGNSKETNQELKERLKKQSEDFDIF
jgi:hypothetical protein